MQQLSDVDGVIGGTLILQCTADGYPRPEIHWERGGKLLGKSRHIQQTRSGENCILRLKNLQESDLGIYQCVATNINGKAVTQCRIYNPGMLVKRTATTTDPQSLRIPGYSSFRSRSADRGTTPRIIRRTLSTSGRLKGERQDHQSHVNDSRKSSRDRSSRSLNQNGESHKKKNHIVQNQPAEAKITITVTQNFGIEPRKSPPSKKNTPLVQTTTKTRYLDSDPKRSNCTTPTSERNVSVQNLVGNVKEIVQKFSQQKRTPREVPRKSMHNNNIVTTSVRSVKDSFIPGSQSGRIEPVRAQSHTLISPQDRERFNLLERCNDSTNSNRNLHDVDSMIVDGTKDTNRTPPVTIHSEFQPLVSVESLKILDVRGEQSIDDPLDGNMVVSSTDHDAGQKGAGNDATALDKREPETTPPTDLPQITIHETDDDEDCDKATKTCTCFCHEKGKHEVQPEERRMETIRYSPDITDVSLEEFPAETRQVCNVTESGRSTNPLSDASLTICLKSPSKILRGPVSATVRNGESVTLTTKFFGTPTNRVTWIRGGSILRDGGSYQIRNEEFISELTIRDVTADDSGKYVFVVENDFGGDSCFASVAVLGFPKPPGGPPTSSDFTDHSLVLSWYGSMFDGGSVLTGYVVEMCQVPGRNWQTAATCVDTSCIVDGLSLGQRYVFRVRARNRYGLGEPSGETQTICLDDYQNPNDEKSEIDELPNHAVIIQKFSEFMDRYDLKEEVGRGKFGKVYRCVDKWTGFPRAAKMIRCRKCKDRTDVRREIEVMKRLRHPKLLSIVGAFESDKMMVMVTEFISGGELFQRVIMDDFVLTESDCILFMRQICDAVNYMHKCSVLHLDLKPENILCKTRTSHQIKIIDFGLSTFHNPNESLCILFGTPEFVAPEVIAFEPVGPASDMWSLGVICYVLLSGLSPFLGDSESETFANITRSTIDFDEEEFENVSQEAKNFISDIIIKNPRRRLTAAECLNHPWLKRAYWLENYPPLSTEKLKKFIIRRKWQKSGTAIRALRRFVTLSRSSAESLGELMTPSTPISPAPTDTSDDSGIFQDSGCFDFSN